MALERCQECNEEVSSDASSCPNCGKTMKKDVGCLLGLAIIFLPIVFAWLTLQSKYKTKSKVVAFGYLAFTIYLAMSGVSINPDTDTSQQNQVNKYSLEEEFQIGGFRYKVHDISKRKRIGNRVHSETPSEGAVFLVASYTIENTGKETSTVLTNDFKIKDSQGRTFDPSSNANTALNMENSDQEILFSELQPGIEKKGMTAFEVPEKSTNKPMELIIPTKEMFSNKKAVIEFKLNE